MRERQSASNTVTMIFPAEPTWVLSLDDMFERKTLTIGMLWLLHGHTLKQVEYLKTAAYVVDPSLTRQHNCLIPW